MNTDNIIEIQEVGPRDGLQNEKIILDTESKIELITMLEDAGLKRIEITSFVSPKYVPQLGDAGDVTSRILEKKSDMLYTCLVPNVIGVERALKNGATNLAVFVSASEAHNRANVNMSIDESMTQLEKVAEKVLEANGTLRAYVVTAFGCPYQGIVPEETVLDICGKFLEMGVSEISLGDTTGMANPLQVKSLVSKVLTKLDGKARLAVHFHNTRGLALVNAYAAFESGVKIFDSAIGGIGGCPFAPGATGNVATEDIVHMFTSMGYDTGIDMDKLRIANRYLEEKLEKQLPAYLGKVDPAWKASSNTEK